VLHTPGVRIVVSGASGLIGSALVPALEHAGHDVVRLVRRTPASADEIEWNPATGTVDPAALAGVEAGVNLNGATIGRRWTAARRKEILASRVESTRLLSTTLASLDPRPSVLVCAGGVGIYGYDRGDEILTEESSLGTGFLAEVGSAWAAAADPAREAGIRVVDFRQGLVLAGGGGVLGELLPFFKLGLGGRVGNGRQWWPWIAIDDLDAGSLTVLGGSMAGPGNLTSPSPATNAQFTKALGKTLRRPTIFPVPAIGAKLVFGEMAEEALLGGQRALPSRLLADGFAFGYPELSEALSHVLAP
jgi:uncharacterized protein (TIGR01777 family)